VIGAARRLSAHGLRALEAVARDQLERGWHAGAQLAVYRDGALQCDLRLGSAAAPDVRMLWFSATKPLTAVAVLMLAERGRLHLDRPIVAVWPEFGQGGKERCTPRHVLTHQGGFPVFPRDFDWSRIGDWEAVTAATAALPALWPPGADTGYHPVTYGFALGELIRRADGRMPAAFLRDELFEPLGLDATLGAAPEQLGTVLALEARSEVTWEDPLGSERRTSELAARFNRPATLSAQLPAATGIGTAVALARFYACLERGGELDGVRVLAAGTVRDATRTHVHAELDRTLGLPADYGLGFVTGGLFEPFSLPGVFGHSGQQCTVGYADPARGLAVAYLTNGLQDPLTVAQRTAEVAAAVIAACEP
jgi:CubicO group peptidase (beta-lactamase class C family)